MFMILILAAGGCSSSVTVDGPEVDETQSIAGVQTEVDSTTASDTGPGEARKTLQSESRNNQSKIDNPVLSPLEF